MYYGWPGPGCYYGVPFYGGAYLALAIVLLVLLLIFGGWWYFTCC
ncbi:hypothetical protein [Falsibacillus pallidus]